MGHAAAVVGDADPPPAAAIGENVDAAGAGIDGVFDQFLDHARGAFDHLAGGDAVDDLFGELADGHEFPRFRFEGWMAILRGQRAKCMRSKYFYGTFPTLPRRRTCASSVAKDS